MSHDSRVRHADKPSKWVRKHCAVTEDEFSLCQRHEGQWPVMR